MGKWQVSAGEHLEPTNKKLFRLRHGCHIGRTCLWFSSFLPLLILLSFFLVLETSILSANLC